MDMKDIDSVAKQLEMLQRNTDPDVANVIRGVVSARMRMLELIRTLATEAQKKSPAG
jgi:hypothetical protein